MKRRRRLAADTRLKAGLILLVAAMWMAIVPPVRALDGASGRPVDASGFHNETEWEESSAIRNDGRVPLDFSPRVVPESPAWIGLAAIGAYMLAGEMLRWRRLRG